MPAALFPANTSRYDIVRASLRQIAPKAEQIGQTFYELLLAKHPSLSPLFAKTNFGMQSKLLVELLAWAVEHLDQPQVFNPRLAELGLRHQSYGVRPEHYDLVGECLLGALERELGPAFNDALRQAWAEVYLIVASAMQEPSNI
jgi:nitric oxide dioxygenase